jgi:hypothetical protein
MQPPDIETVTKTGLFGCLDGKISPILRERFQQNGVTLLAMDCQLFCFLGDSHWTCDRFVRIGCANTNCIERSDDDENAPCELIN